MRDANGCTRQQARLWFVGEVCFWVAIAADAAALAFIGGWAFFALLAVSALFGCGHSWFKDRAIASVWRDVADLEARLREFE